MAGREASGGVPDEENPYDIDRCLGEGFLVFNSQDDQKGQESKKVSTEDQSTGNVALMALNTTKAGMEGLDVATINKIIQESSEGSKFYEHKKKQQEKVDQRIREIQYQLEKLTPDQIEKASVNVAKLVEEIEAGLDLNRYFVHLDMDAFFASVEIRDDPSLKDIPMAVGSDSMLSTSNYAARRFGVRAGMPGFIARKLCPQIRLVPINFHKYQEASRQVEQCILDYDPNLHMSMDEADLDITPLVLCKAAENPNSSKDSIAWEICEEMRRKIETGTNLTASAGIAPTRFLAKLCSDLKKPNGQCAMTSSHRSIRAFLSAIPIRKVCGIGNVTEQLLKGVDVHNCKDLWDKRAILWLLFKPASFHNLLGISMGTGNVMWRDTGGGGGGQKSMSCERTFKGTGDQTFLSSLCKELSQEVERDLKSANMIGRTITLKLKTTEFDVKSRAKSIPEGTDCGVKIYEVAWKIFQSYLSENPGLSVRLMGVRLSGLEDKDGVATNNQKSIYQFISNGSEKVPGESDKNKCVTTCPVCQCPISGESMEQAEALMDKHIDDCLSKSTVKEVRSELNPPGKQQGKRMPSSSVGNEPKKRRKEGGTAPNQQGIDSFFKRIV